MRRDDVKTTGKVGGTLKPAVTHLLVRPLGRESGMKGYGGLRKIMFCHP